MVITHRFSTARIADMIHVMSDGQVIERGSHDELISAGGRYAEGWSAQAHP
jgi:ABC-type multidrug transport system fused ATPase/permease subunit